MTKKELIGHNIKKYREEALLSTRDLAYFTGHHHNTIKRWETAETPIGAIDLYQIAKILNIPIGKFFKKTEGDI